LTPRALPSQSAIDAELMFDDPAPKALSVGSISPVTSAGLPSHPSPHVCYVIKTNMNRVAPQHLFLSQFVSRSHTIHTGTSESNVSPNDVAQQLSLPGRRTLNKGIVAVQMQQGNQNGNQSRGRIFRASVCVFALFSCLHCNCMHVAMYNLCSEYELHLHSCIHACARFINSYEKEISFTSLT